MGTWLGTLTNTEELAQLPPLCSWAPSIEAIADVKRMPCKTKKQTVVKEPTLFRPHEYMQLYITDCPPKNNDNNLLKIFGSRFDSF